MGDLRLGIVAARHGAGRPRQIEPRETDLAKGRFRLRGQETSDRSGSRLVLRTGY
jgi:hypothetical protein